MRRTFRLCMAMVIAWVLLCASNRVQPLLPFPGFQSPISPVKRAVSHPVDAVSTTLLPGSVATPAGLSDGKIQPIAAQVEKKNNRLHWRMGRTNASKKETHTVRTVAGLWYNIAVGNAAWRMGVHPL